MSHPLRKIIFWLHLIAGVTAGLIILLLALTGVILTYERQIIAWADAQEITAPAGASRLSLEILVPRVAGATPGQPVTAISVEHDAAQPVALSFGREKVVFANPYTAEVLGEGAPKVRAFFQWVTGLHRWLALEGESRETGKAITGAACLVFFFLVLSGLYLWWPRRWTWHFVKRIVSFDKRLTGRARNWNWHNVFGFWACVPLMLIVLTGLIMAYSWANNLLFTLTGNDVPPPRGGQSRPQGGKPVAVPLDGLERAFALAVAKVPEWETITVRLPATPEAPATFMVSESHRGRPDKKAQLTVKLATGEESGWEPFSSYNLGRQLRLWSRWVHTGEAGGIVGQTVAGAAAFGALILVWTGFALSWQRFRRRKG